MAGAGTTDEPMALTRADAMYIPPTSALTWNRQVPVVKGSYGRLLTVSSARAACCLRKMSNSGPVQQECCVRPFSRRIMKLELNI